MYPLIRQRHRTAVVGLVAAALLAGGTCAAVADGGTVTPAATAPAPTAPAAKAPPTGDGAHRLCARVPKIDRRIARALKRLNAGAGVRGSVARLQRRVDNAEKAGHDAIKTYLDDKLTFRKSLVPTLQQRQTDLADVKTWCGAHNNGKKES